MSRQNSWVALTSFSLENLSSAIYRRVNSWSWSDTFQLYIDRGTIMFLRMPVATCTASTRALASMSVALDITYRGILGCYKILEYTLTLLSLPVEYKVISTNFTVWSDKCARSHLLMHCDVMTHELLVCRR